MNDQAAYEPVPDEVLAAMINLGVALGEIDQADADDLLAPLAGGATEGDQ